MNITERAKLYFKAKGVNHLRLTLKPKGCGGFEYHFEEWSTPRQSEVLLVADGIGFLVEGEVALSVAGGTIDYVSQGLSSYLTIIDNPAEKGRCGCGLSVNLETS